MRRSIVLAFYGLMLLAHVPVDAAGRLDAEGCAALDGRAVSADAISLPTRGARVSDTAWEPGPDGSAMYCRVMGSILPVDRSAPAIEWQANLPEAWNGKLLQYGGGGFNGRIPRTLGQPTLGLPNVPVPLARGYVTFGSDSGHQSNASDASFAHNAEALGNYAYMHIRKTHDVVRGLVGAAYGADVEYVYFAGGSTGGREALTAAIRWPEIYDGVLSNYPTARFLGLRLWGAALTHAIYSDDSAGWIPPALVRKIAARAIETCDGLDGARDGLVSNVSACRAQSGALVDEFRCPEGAGSDDCLSATQIERTIRVYHEGYELPYELAHGFRRYEGYNSLEGVLMDLGDQPAYDEPPRSGPHAHHANRAYQFFTNFVMTEKPTDFRNFDLARPGHYEARLRELSELVDATDPDLSRFAQAGGKIILVHGVEDQSVSPLGVQKVYENIVARAGRETADGFIRFYMVPGLAHGGGNMSPAWDNLSALERWVEDGIPPAGYTVTDTTDSPTRGRTRPLCAYPTWPQYTGDGDINEAASYRCATE